jgi:pimeloyl-ACP methyl ester carboxylesterase
VLGIEWIGLRPARIDNEADQTTVVIHDHRGTGQSSRSHIHYTVDQMTDDLLVVMDHLKIEKAHLVGHSTGGAIGQTLAANRSLAGAEALEGVYVNLMTAVDSMDTPVCAENLVRLIW